MRLLQLTKKNILGIVILSSAITVSKAQFSDHFENNTVSPFVTVSNAFSGENLSESNSSMIINSAGHDEWDAINVGINNGTSATTISMNKNTKIYI